MSLVCPKPSNASHLILNKAPWFYSTQSGLNSCTSRPLSSAPATLPSLRFLKCPRHSPTAGPLHCRSNLCWECPADICLASPNFLQTSPQLAYF